MKIIAFNIALGSRILGGMVLASGTPLHKYALNRILTLIQNIMLGQKLSEYHTGLRAFSRRVIEALPLASNSDDFVFDNQMLVQAVYFGYRIGEVIAPYRYTEESSSTNFTRSITYGIGVLSTSLQFVLQKARIIKSPMFETTKAGYQMHLSRDNR